MAHTVTTVSAPVSFADVNAVLGTNHTDLGMLCQDKNIKMWAKWKPIPYAYLGILSNSVRESNNYGIANIPTWSNLGKMGNFMLGISRTSSNAPDIGVKPFYWGYTQPSGGSSEPFRLSDFVNQNGSYGYYHGAEPPVGKSMFSNYSIDSSGNLRISFANGAQDIRTVKLDELSYPVSGYDIGNMYFGVIMRKEGSNTVYVATSHKISQIPSQGAHVDISGLSSSYNGTWYIAPIASADQISFTSNISGYTNGKFVCFSENYEVVGIGTTIVKFEITANSFWARRDTSQSTRLLYVGLNVKNVNSGQKTARIDFDVFNSNNVSLATGTYNVSGVSAGNTTYVSTSIDMSSLVNLRNAFSVRAIVTPTNVSNYGTDSAAATVVDGHPRD